MPAGKRLIEPFVGSGVIFLNTDYPNYILNDINTDLISVYQCLKNEGSTFIQKVENYFIPENNNKIRYYELREAFNASHNKETRAELFIYLNRHSFNGLCRYNQKGKFNVPFGRYDVVHFPNRILEKFSKKLRKATLKSIPFDDVFKLAKPGDIVYCDPPYVSNHNSLAFKYFGKDFTLDDQKKLAFLAKVHQSRGITTLISNHVTEETLSLYKEANQIFHFQAFRSMNCDPTQRKHVNELLAVY
jgi:DNA adenine methylase